MYKAQIYIQFRELNYKHLTFKSPVFESPINLYDSDSLDDLVADGDEESGFCISCDMSMHQSNDLTKIIWEMFEPFDANWIDDLVKIWKKTFNFDLPQWSEWKEINSLKEAYV
jgi:hypothetical protein